MASVAHIINDPRTDDVIRRAFGRVTCQIVRFYDDGSVGRINMTSRAKAELERIEHAKRIGRTFHGGVKLVAVEIEDVA